MLELSHTSPLCNLYAQPEWALPDAARPADLLRHACMAEHAYDLNETGSVAFTEDVDEPVDEHQRKEPFRERANRVSVALALMYLRRFYEGVKK